MNAERDWKVANKGVFLLGDCPHCGTMDSLAESWRTRWRIKCCNCWTIWPDFQELCEMEKIEGHRLIPVEVRRYKTPVGGEAGIELFEPMTKNEIPQHQLVLAALNATMITKFHLGVALGCEGGVEGSYKGSYISFSNGIKSLGLWAEYDYAPMKRITEVVNFYEQMLARLFIKGFFLDGIFHRPGELLRLDNQNQDVSTVWKIISDSLTYIEDKNFSMRVMRQIVDCSDSPWGFYLRGMLG